MADVTIPVVGDGPADRPQGRGQMLLVAAFGIAVMLVTLALILNTSIYTENIATRGSDIGGGNDAIRYRASTQSSVAGTIEYANYNNNSSYTYLEDNVTAGVDGYTNLSGRQQASDGAVANVSVKELHRGTRVYQNSDRNFTNVSETETWIVASDVTDLRGFEVNIATNELTQLDPGDGSDDFDDNPEFFIVFDVPSDPDDAHISIYEDENTGEYTVNVKDPWGNPRRTCRVPSSTSRLVIDVTGGTVNGEDCDPLDFVGNLSTPFVVSFNDTIAAANDPSVVGTYNFTVNQSVSTFDANLPEDHYTNESGLPERTEAIYSTTVHLTYETHRVRYETDIRVAPGEPDD